MAAASERDAPWPFHDAARVVCSFLLPADIAKLHTVSRSVRGCIDARDLLWQRIRARMSTFADIVDGCRFPLPLPPWMVLHSNVLAWALCDRWEPNLTAFPTYSIAVKEDDIAQAALWIESNFIWAKGNGVVVLNVSQVEPLCFITVGSGVCPWKSNYYSVGRRISRLGPDEDPRAWTAVWLFTPRGGGRPYGINLMNDSAP